MPMRVDLVQTTILGHLVEWLATLSLQREQESPAVEEALSLRNLRIRAAIVNTFFFLFGYLHKNRSLFVYFISSTPSFICHLRLERRYGRKYIPGTCQAVNNTVEFYLIVSTWCVAVIVALFGDKFWLIWFIGPVSFACFFVYVVLGMGLADPDQAYR